MTKVTPSTQKVQMEPCAGNHGQSQRYCLSWGFPGGLVIKNLPPVQETQEMRVRSLGWEDPMEEEMATHSSMLAWGIPWTEEPGGLQATGSQRVGHDWATSTTTMGTARPAPSARWYGRQPSVQQEALERGFPEQRERGNWEDQSFSWKLRTSQGSHPDHATSPWHQRTGDPERHRVLSPPSCLSSATPLPPPPLEPSTPNSVSYVPPPDPESSCLALSFPHSAILHSLLPQRCAGVLGSG